MSGVTEKRTPTKLKELCTITSSKRIYAADYVDEGVPFVRGKEVVQRFSHLGKLQSELFISRTKFEIIKDRFGAPKGGDLLLTSVGTLGVPYLVADYDEFYFKDGNLIWFRELKELNGKFFYYWLQSHAGKAQLQKCTIGTSQPAYTIERLKEIDVPDFSLIKQASIASFLSAYDDLIESNRRRIQLLEQAARLLYKEWFVHLRFPGHEHTQIIDGVPEGWEKMFLGDVCFEVRETVSPSSLEANTPYIGLEHMPRRSITLCEWGQAEQITSSKHRFREGEILFGKIRPYFHKVGIALTDGVASSDAIIIRPVHSHLLPLLLMTTSSDGFVAVTAQQMKEGSKMPRADWKQMQQYPVPLPPDGLLRAFNEFIDPILNQLKTLAFTNKRLGAARDLLLPKLMNGEVAV